MFKSGFVAIIGKPNVGKSTLLNLLIGEKIAIVSHKPQATRKSVRGILTTDDYQIIFVDTPGIHKSQKKLNEAMIKYIDEAIDDFDVALVITDNQGTIDDIMEEYLRKIASKNKKSLLVINKIDLMDRKRIEEIKNRFTEIVEFDEIIETSLTSSADAKEKILTALLSLLEEGPRYYEDDIISTETERFIISEIIREKIMNLVAKEVPYHIAVVVDEMKYRQEKGIYYIKATIIVERKTQKMIVIGKDGKLIKEIGKLARIDIENFLDSRVFLELWVKVKENWTKKEKAIKEYMNPRY